jgi:hypothetical protein
MISGSERILTNFNTTGNESSIYAAFSLITDFVIMNSLQLYLLYSYTVASQCCYESLSNFVISFFVCPVVLSNDSVIIINFIYCEYH